MMFHRLGLINKNQRGFTLIELVIAIAITGLITGGITTSIFQVFDINALTSNHMVAVRQVQNAGYWISRDAQMAQSMVITGVSGFPLTLTWTEYVAPNDVHQVTYTLDEVLKELQRQHLVHDSDGTEILNEVMVVAQYIDRDETNCEVVAGIAGGTFTLPDGSSDTDEFTITDAVGGDSGIISVSMPGDILRATPVGGATVAGVTFPNTVIINIAKGEVAWTTPDPSSMIIFTNISNSHGTAGSWTATTGTATVTITADDNNDATLADGDKLIMTVTATVQEQSETRIYEIVPRPGS